MSGELIIVGVGPRGLGQLTLESLEALKSCRLVLAAVRGPELQHLCRGLKVRCVRLPWSGEAAGGLGTKALAARARKELARGGRTAVVVDGNPALFSVADALPPAKRYAALSAFDQSLVALRAEAGDLAASGVRALNLAACPPRTRLCDPDALTLLFNLGGMARLRPRVAEGVARRLARERAGRLWLVECADGGDVVTPTTPAALARDAKNVGVNATLAVAPSRRRA
ncbi:MAG: hypothetical protein HYZ75_18035 [Elusimicrobia bacterium]|nr:hypothetical protein [Elusimicrobiota bacterium]